MSVVDLDLVETTRILTSSSVGPSTNGSRLSTLCSLSKRKAFDNLSPGVDDNVIFDPRALSLSMMADQSYERDVVAVQVGRSD